MPDQRYALRIDPEPADADLLAMVEAEMCWLSALRQDTALSVPEPVAGQDETWVQVVSVGGVPGAHPVTLLKWMPGKLVGDRPTPAMMVQMGAFMAHLHDHAGQFSFPDGITRPHTEWSKLAYWTDPRNDTFATLTPERRNLCAISIGQA